MVLKLFTVVILYGNNISKFHQWILETDLKCNFIKGTKKERSILPLFLDSDEQTKDYDYIVIDYEFFYSVLPVTKKAAVLLKLKVIDIDPIFLSAEL